MNEINTMMQGQKEIMKNIEIMLIDNLYNTMRISKFESSLAKASFFAGYVSLYSVATNKFTNKNITRAMHDKSIKIICCEEQHFKEAIRQ